MSISTEIQRLQNAKADLKTAIESKGVTVSSGAKLDDYADLVDSISTGITPTGSLSISANGTYDVTSYASADVSVGGAVEAEIKDVNFFDYDGTCVYSYTFDEWANQTELPELPTHNGLIGEGWALFDDVQSINNRISDVPKQSVYVFPYYKTYDGKTRAYFEFITDYNIAFSFGVNGEISIDWGDGSPTENLTGTALTTRVSLPHEYAKGKYVMTIEVVSGSFQFHGTNGSSWFMCPRGNTASVSDAQKSQGVRSALTKLEFGDDVSFGDSGFYNYKYLKSITVHRAINPTNARLFYGCTSLRCHPKGDFSAECLNGTTIRFSTTNISNSTSKYQGSNIRDVCFGNITAIPQNCFYACCCLARVFVPSTVTSIAVNAFYGCSSLKEIHLHPTTPPSLANSTVFTQLPSNAVMYVPYSADHSILNAYQTATNWSTYASYMQEEPQ